MATEKPAGRSRKTPDSTHDQKPLFAGDAAPDAFKKAVEVVHSKPKALMGNLERKMANAWMKRAVQREPDPDGFWSIGLKELAVDVGFTSNNSEHLKDVARTLMTIVYEWDVVSTQARSALWKASVLFPDVEIKTGVIRFQIGHQLREHIRNPEIFALIDMNVIRKFQRTSSTALYENCVRFVRVGRTPEFPWETFRDMLLGEGSGEGTYSQYKYFKSKVLGPSIVEVNALSDIEITLIEQKIGRAIVSVKFAIKRKHSAMLENADVPIDLVSELVQLGLMQSEAKRLFKNKSVIEVREALAYTRSRMGSGKKGTPLQNPAAYFRTALESGWKLQPVEDIAPAKEVNPLPQPHSQDLIRSEYQRVHFERAKTEFAEFDAPDQTQLINEYNAQQPTKALKLNATKPSKAAEAGFFSWMVKRNYGEPTAEALLDFASRLFAKAPGAVQ